MVKQRLARLMGALLLVLVGVEGLISPLTHVALMRSMPDCVEAGRMAAAVGLELHVLTAGTNCPQGTLAPAASYHVVAQAALTISVTALLLGIVALVLAVGVGLRARRVVRELRQWFSHRFRMIASVASEIVVQLGQPVMVPVVVRSARMASRPYVRRGPPSCSH
jgi:hypothetical protein